MVNADSVGGDASSDDGEPWPPVPPDMVWSAVSEACEESHLHFSSNSQIFKFEDCAKVFKWKGTQREYDLMCAAGECSIRPHGRRLRRDQNSKVDMDGFVMEYGNPTDFKAVDSTIRRDLVSQMCSLVHTLHHEKRIVHGDIKTVNMLFRIPAAPSSATAETEKQRPQLCLCDLGESRWVDEHLELWNGMVTDNYSSPHRCRAWPAGPDPAPEIVDDLYSLEIVPHPENERFARR